MSNPKSNLRLAANVAVFLFGCTSNTDTISATGGATQAASGGVTARSSAAPTGGKKTIVGKGGSTQDSSGESDTGEGGGSVTADSTAEGGSTNGRSSGGNGGKSSSTGGKPIASGGKIAVGGTRAAAGASTSETRTSEPGAGGQETGPSTYALPPPSQCHNQDYVPYESGCRDGDSGSTCGGKCKVINACAESEATKPNADVTFICRRFMLFSPEMIQAAKDDSNEAFNYAIVGHDTDPSGIDGAGARSTCCQCYQLVYAYPSPDNDSQCLVDPNNKTSPKSALPIPPPLIVQSFNTAATPQTFDVYMAAGGLGNFNACAHLVLPNGGELKSVSGQYLYSSYPTVGQGSGGGVKPVTHYDAECKTKDTRWVTAETFSSDACQNKVKAACNEIESNVPGLAEQSRSSCIKGNSPESPYHLNWSVYAMKVECPAHLTQVTGCKLASQGLPAVKRNVTTAEQAAADPDFKARANGGNKLYETTTMEDCCRPSCAATNWVEKMGLKPEGKYNAFYSCDAKGVPITEKE